MFLESYNGWTDCLVPTLEDVDCIVEESTGLVIRIIESSFERSEFLTWILSDEVVQEIYFISHVPSN